jgi:hypothetical protein
MQIASAFLIGMKIKEIKNTDPTAQYVCSVFDVTRSQIGYAIGSSWELTHCYVNVRYTKS